MTQSYAGKCLCGSVTYVANGPPVVTAQCHCKECRTLSGAGHSTGAMFARSDVALEGKLREYRYTSAKGTTVTKAFCPSCGSPILGTNSGSPDHITLTLGTMIDASDLDVDVVIFARDKPRWYRVTSSVLTFDTQPEWTPDPEGVSHRD